MNNELHHKWNERRDRGRKNSSVDDDTQILQENVSLNKVTLKQVGPQRGKIIREI